MKQRVVSALIGLLLFFIILFFFETHIYNIAVSFLAILMVYEVLSAYKYTNNKLLSGISFIFAGIVPLIITKEHNMYTVIAIIIYVGLLFGIALKFHDKIDLKQISHTFFTSMIYPFAISTLIYIRNQFGLYDGMYYTLLIFACAWGSDTGAYFAGRFFGKKKLAPNISPNKTIEGLYGGVTSCLFFVALVTIVYYYVMKSLQITININYIYLVLISIAASFIGVMGDLCASLTKRQCNVKDFGSIMPGHGGVMDRFDSVLFIAPFFYVVLQFIKCVS